VDVVRRQRSNFKRNTKDNKKRCEYKKNWTVKDEKRKNKSD